ncbi:hypothetical protein ACFW08_37235 [Streptomyces sp. NPDC058960]
MWVLIVVAVPLYLVCLVQGGYLAEQRIRRGNVAESARHSTQR